MASLKKEIKVRKVGLELRKYKKGLAFFKKFATFEIASRLPSPT